MQVPHKVVKADQLHCAGDLSGEQGIAETEERVDWIGGWTLHTSGKRPLFPVCQQLPKATKVGRASCPFYTENRFQRCACNAIVAARQSVSTMGLYQWQCCHLVKERRYLLNRLPHLTVGLTAVIALQHRALIGQLADHEAARQLTACSQILMRPVLRHAQDGI